MTRIYRASGIGNGIANDGNYIAWTLEQHPCNANYIPDFGAFGAVLADFGVAVTGVTKIEIRSGKISGSNPAPGAPYQTGVYYASVYNNSIESQAPYGFEGLTIPAGWEMLNNNAWIPFDNEVDWVELYDSEAELSLRYVYCKANFSPSYGTYPASHVVGVDTIRVYGTYTEGGGTVTPWGLAVDFEDGANVFVTYQRSTVGGAAFSYLVVFDSSLNPMRKTSLNPFGVSVAYPRVTWQPGVTNYGDIVYVFGAGSAGGLVLESLDAGVTLTDRSGDLSAVTAVAALAAKGDGAGQVTNFYAFTDTPDVYAETAWAWTLVGSVPFTLHRNALSIAYDAALTAAVGNVEAGAAMAETTPSPYSAYTDITGGLPIDGGCVRLEWITP